MYGGTLPASIWQQTMREAMRPLPVKGFQPADPVVARGDGSADRTAVPDVSRASYDEAVRRLTSAGFQPVQGRTVASGVPAGRVAYTSPRAGRSATGGSKVFVYRSSGPAPAPPAPAPAPAPVEPPPTTEVAPAAPPAPPAAG